MKLQEIAERLGGTVEGDGSLEITGVNGMELAEQGQITFLAERKFKDQLKTCNSPASTIKLPSPKVLNWGKMSASVRWLPLAKMW